MSEEGNPSFSSLPEITEIELIETPVSDEFNLADDSDRPTLMRASSPLRHRLETPPLVVPPASAAFDAHEAPTVPGSPVPGARGRINTSPMLGQVAATAGGRRGTPGRRVFAPGWGPPASSAPPSETPKPISTVVETHVGSPPLAQPAENVPGDGASPIAADQRNESPQHGAPPARSTPSQPLRARPTMVGWWFGIVRWGPLPIPAPLLWLSVAATGVAGGRLVEHSGRLSFSPWVESWRSEAPQPELPPAPSCPPPEQPTPAPSVSAPPPAPSAPLMTNPSVAMRSAVGDADAIEELCARPDGGHAIAEAVAIGVGLRARAFAQVQELRLELLETPARLENPMTLQAVIERVTDPRTSPEMMDILARIGTPLAADLLYDAWISTPERNSMTEMARRLVYSPEVRRNASAALDIALTLRALESCEGVDALVARAALVGDERVLRPIAQMASWNECKASPDECHPCEVNHGDVAAAVAAAQKRPAPMFLR